VTVRLRSGSSVTLAVGDVWVIDVRVTDVDRLSYVDDPATVTITLPAGGTVEPVVEALGSGRYLATYAVGATGRYVARVITATSGTVDATAYVEAVTTAAQMPTITDLDNWLGPETHSWSDDDLQDALDVEASNQRDMCRVPAVYPKALRGALLRRAARHLALRAPRPEASDQGETGALARQYGRDSEVRRLEAPWRKLTVG